ncbi:MAG: four helix bundle protein [Candidatus Paceibacterota bacterium]
MVILKEKEAYQFWLTIHRNFPRVERLGIGQKIEDLFLDTLEFSFSCIYLPPETKTVMLGRTITKVDTLKFFYQLAWESKLMPTDKYTELSEKLEEIGRMLGGWRKGLQSPSAKSTLNKTLTK